MSQSIAKEAREMAQRMRELLDASTPGPWAGVNGPDRRRDRGVPREGAIETEFASGKRVIGEKISGQDKAFILYARNHFGRVAELLDKLAAEEGEGPSTPPPAAAASGGAPGGGSGAGSGAGSATPPAVAPAKPAPSVAPAQPAAAPATKAPPARPAAEPTTPTSPTEIDVGAHISGDGFEIDLSSVEDVNVDDLAETLKKLGD